MKVSRTKTAYFLPGNSQTQLRKICNQRRSFLQPSSLNARRVFSEAQKKRLHRTEFPIAVMGGGGRFGLSLITHMINIGCSEILGVLRSPEEARHLNTNHFHPNKHRFSFLTFVPKDEDRLIPRRDEEKRRILCRRPNQLNFISQEDSEFPSEIRKKKIILFSVSSSGIEEQAHRLREIGISEKVNLISVIKGFVGDPDNPDQPLLVTELLRRYFPNNPIFYMGGPTFAYNMAYSEPMWFMVVSTNPNNTKSTDEIALVFNSRSSPIRFEPSDDPIGVQLGGALKNIVALAAGACIGHGFPLGESTHQAIICLGLREMCEYILRQGGKLETISGPAIGGDLNMTAGSDRSRNFLFGRRWIEMQKDFENIPSTITPEFIQERIDQILQQDDFDRQTVEGVRTVAMIKPHLDKIIAKTGNPDPFRLFLATYHMIYSFAEPKSLIKQLVNPRGPTLEPPPPESPSLPQ